MVKTMTDNVVNTDAINEAIRVMERVRDNGYRLDMDVFVDCITPDIVTARSETQLHLG